MGSVSLVCVEAGADDELKIPSGGQQSGRLTNTEFLSDANTCLSYLPEEHKRDILALFE